MLFENGETSSERPSRRRYFLKALILLCGALLVGGMVFVISQIPAGSRFLVFSAEAFSEETGRKEAQAALMGVVSGVSDMERFSDAAGTEKREVQQAVFQEAVSCAGQVGPLAEQIVLTNRMASSEYDTLLKIVEAEATGGDVKSKMMVAGVVLNRVNDPHFPDTVYDVVFEEYQFTPTSDGRFYSCEITEDTRAAVERVLAGEDYSEGALFFVARSSADPSELSWFDSSLTWLFQYGGHDFYSY